MQESNKVLLIGDPFYSYSDSRFILLEQLFPSFAKQYGSNFSYGFYGNVTVKRNSISLEMELKSYGGREDYNFYDGMEYPSTNYFILCFDYSRENSKKNIQDRWYPQLKKHKSDALFIFLGLNFSEAEKVIFHKEEVMELSKELGSFCFLELNNENKEEGTKELLEKIHDMITINEKKLMEKEKMSFKRNKCCIM